MFALRLQAIAIVKPTRDPIYRPHIRDASGRMKIAHLCRGICVAPKWEPLLLLLLLLLCDVVLSFGSRVTGGFIVVSPTPLFVFVCLRVCATPENSKLFRMHVLQPQQRRVAHRQSRNTTQHKQKKRKKNKCCARVAAHATYAMS